MSLTLVITLVLASSAICSALTNLAYARLPERRLHRSEQRKSMGAGYPFRLLGNAVLSPALVFGFTHLLAARLFTAEAPSLLRGALQVAGILAFYDTLYYFMHRFLFHQWPVLRAVHAVHHKVRYPTTLDSLFLHPVEALAGLSLFMFSIWVIGPIHVYTFGGCFLVYSWLNIVVHAGVRLPIPYVGMLSRNHAIHHVDMKSGNYANLTPLPDMLFGTAE